MTLTPHLHPDWFIGVDDRQRLVKGLQDSANSLVLRILREILDRKVQTLTNEELKTDYDNASWSHRQAHINGNKEILRYIDQVLGFVNKDK